MPQSKIRTVDIGLSESTMIIQLQEKSKTITSPKNVVEILRSILAAEDEITQDKEHFWTFHLNTRSSLICLELVSLGTIDTSVVHPREVFTRAVANRSSSLVIAHNHPSGVCEPSTQDIAITECLVEAGTLLDIPIVDHIIVGNESHYSFRETGLI